MDARPECCSCSAPVRWNVVPSRVAAMALIAGSQGRSAEGEAFDSSKDGAKT